jgi:hypothetical protein
VRLSGNGVTDVPPWKRIFLTIPSEEPDPPMTPDLHDRSLASGEGARGDESPTASMLAAIRRTFTRTAVDADARPEFERAICDYVIVARARGEPVERIIVDLKQELAGITPSDLRRGADLVELAVRTCIRQYYEEET